MTSAYQVMTVTLASVRAEELVERDSGHRRAAGVHVEWHAACRLGGIEAEPPASTAAAAIAAAAIAAAAIAAAAIAAAAIASRRVGLAPRRAVAVDGLRGRPRARSEGVLSEWDPSARPSAVMGGHQR